MAKTARTARLRHLRHRKLARFRQNAAGTYRSDATMGFLSREATRLDTATDQDVSAVDDTDDELTITGHGLSNGDGPIYFEGDDLPAGITAGTPYWISVVNANAISIYPTQADAIAKENGIDITDQGSGTVTLTENATIATLFAKIKDEEVKPETVKSSSDFKSL